MHESLIETRIGYAFRYLKFDAEIKKLDWRTGVEIFNSDDQFKLPELMALIHPRYQKSFGLDSREVYGPTTFSPAGQSAKCRAKEIWGYGCPFVGSKIHIDHSFPRSRGGATNSKNAMYLCDQHNIPKSSDVHLFPWENLPQQMDWVDQVLNIFVHEETRNSGRTMHFSKLKKMKL